MASSRLRSVWRIPDAGGWLEHSGHGAERAAAAGPGDADLATLAGLSACVTLMRLQQVVMSLPGLGAAGSIAVRLAIPDGPLEAATPFLLRLPLDAWEMEILTPGCPRPRMVLPTALVAMQPSSQEPPPAVEIQGISSLRSASGPRDDERAAEGRMLATLVAGGALVIDGGTGNLYRVPGRACAHRVPGPVRQAWTEGRLLLVVALSQLDDRERREIRLIQSARASLGMTRQAPAEAPQAPPSDNTSPLDLRPLH